MKRTPKRCGCCPFESRLCSYDCGSSATSPSSPGDATSRRLGSPVESCLCCCDAASKSSPNFHRASSSYPWIGRRMICYPYRRPRWRRSHPPCSDADASERFFARRRRAAPILLPPLLPPRLSATGLGTTPPTPTPSAGRRANTRGEGSPVSFHSIRSFIRVSEGGFNRGKVNTCTW